MADARQHTGVTYEEYLHEHGSLTYTNVGTSMMPLLREGRDLFTVVPKEGRCSVGDVVLYRRPPSRWVLHRVVKVLPDGYLTLGDNCVARERVAEDDVIGVMTGFVRGERNGRNGRKRVHNVDEPGYRAYARAVLATERPRVLLKRALSATRRRISALRPTSHAQRDSMRACVPEEHLPSAKDQVDGNRDEGLNVNSRDISRHRAPAAGDAEAMHHAQ